MSIKQKDKNMNWEEYLPLAEKTLSTQFNCKEEFYQKILHAVIGSLTEVEEILDNYSDGVLITDINKQGSVAEESADIFWYLSILFRELNISRLDLERNSIEKIDTKNPFNTLISFTKLSLKFLDLLKKKIYYNKDININEMVDISSKMYLILSEFCNQYNTKIDDILDKNIAKLKARYGEKFSSERAINRDLETERNILEGN
jgi:NTP pyrophosphatase (non-canonical NTP hydrolase)